MGTDPSKGTPSMAPTGTVPRRTRSVVVIANPAGGGALDDDQLRAGIEAACGDGCIVTYSPTTEDDPGTGQAARAVRDGATTVIACGGDGTVRAVLESIAGTDTTLGIIPLGTGNLLAANLGLEAGLDAADVALHGTARRLDVARVNGERFAVMAGAGFDALMIRDASSAVKRRLGSVAYVLSAARHLPARFTTATVTVDGERVWRGRTAMVLTGNCGTVSGGLTVFPDAAPDDGRLEVAVLAARSPRQWCSVLWRLIRGIPQRPELVARFSGRDVEVALHPPMVWELDGEDRPATDRLTFAVEPLALQVHAGPMPTDSADTAGSSARTA